TGIEQKIPIVTLLLQLLVELLRSADEFVFEMVPHHAHLKHFRSDGQSALQLLVVFDLLSNCPARQVDVRVQGNVEVLHIPTNTITTSLLDVQELGQTDFHAFALRDDDVERNARWTMFTPQVDDGDRDQVGVTLHIVFFVAREFHFLVRGQQNADAGTVPAVAGQEAEVLRDLLELQVTFEELQALDSRLVHVQLILLADVTGHDRVDTATGRDVGNLFDHLALDVRAFHVDHVQT